MKKIFTLMVACAFAVAGWAQDNLARNPQGGGSVTATADVNAEGGAAAAIDGNTGTRWSSNAEGKETAYFQLTWENPQTFNTVKMLCEGAMGQAHTYLLQTSTNGEDWTTIYGEGMASVTTAGNQYEIIEFEEVTTKYLRLQQGDVVGTWGLSFWEFEVYNLERAVFTSIEVSPKYVVPGQPTDITIAALNQYGTNMAGVDLTNVSVTNGTYADGKVTPTAAGDVVVTVTVDGTPYNYTITALPAVSPITDEDYALVFGEGKTSGKMEKAWEGGYKGVETINLGTTPIYVVDDAKTFGISPSGEDIAISSYKSVVFDIYVDAATEGTANVWNADGYTKSTKKGFVLQAGKWNHVSVAINGNESWVTGEEGNIPNTDKLSMVAWYFSNATDFLVTNVYLSKAEASEPLIIASTPGNKNFYAVTGPITAKNKAEIEGLTHAALDLTGANIAPEVTEIHTANGNTLFAITDAQAAQLTGNTKNTINLGNWVVSRTPIELDESNGLIWACEDTNGYFAVADRGFSYTRTIKANTYATVTLPGNLSTLPDGLTAYEMTGATAEEVTFTEHEGALAKDTPYIVKAGESDVVITVNGNGDVAQNAGSIEYSPVIFKGNYDRFNGTAEGNLYGLSANTTTPVFKKIGASANVGPFRAYFIVNGVAPSNVRFVDSTLTTIATVATSEIEGFTFNLAGQRVNNANGIVVKNGKKVIR